MAKLGGTKFTWVINNFSSLKSETRHSLPYEIGTTGYAWLTCCLGAARKELEHEYLSVTLFYRPLLPTELKIYLKYCLTIVNQLSEELPFKEGMQWFYPMTIDMACTSVVLLPKVFDKDSSFLVNDQVKIVVEFDIFQDIPVETEKSEENVGVLLKEGSSIMESFNVNGFHVFPSQVVSVRRIFEKHPDIAVDFRAKNQHVRNACMSYLLGLIETLCQSLHQLSDEDLIEADIALKHLKDAGFKVDWLEKNLEHVKGKKIKELSVLAMLQETEGKSQKLKREFEELDAFAEEQKKELTSTRTSLSFDDVV